MLRRGVVPGRSGVKLLVGFGFDLKKRASKVHGVLHVTVQSTLTITGS